MDKERVSELVGKVVDETITDEERQELLDAMPKVKKTEDWSTLTT